MHTKSAILFTVIMLSGASVSGCESASDTAGEDSTLAMLGVELRNPAVRAEWEAKCAGDAAVIDVPEDVSDAGAGTGAIDDDGDDDADEVAEESAGGGDHDRADKICRYLNRHHGGHGWRGDHDRGHDERGGRGDDDGRFDERECDHDGGSDEGEQGDDDDQGDEGDDNEGDQGAPEAP